MKKVPKPLCTIFHLTILVTDERGLQVDMEDVEFCQRFQSEDFDTRTSWSVHAEQCETVDIDDGVAILSNWEGEYFGPDVSIVVEMKKDDDVFLQHSSIMTKRYGATIK